MGLPHGAAGWLRRCVAAAQWKVRTAVMMRGRRAAVKNVVCITATARHPKPTAALACRRRAASSVTACNIFFFPFLLSRFLFLFSLVFVCVTGVLRASAMRSTPIPSLLFFSFTSFNINASTRLVFGAGHLMNVALHTVGRAASIQCCKRQYAIFLGTFAAATEASSDEVSASVLWRTAVLPKLPHCNYRKIVPNRPLGGRLNFWNLLLCGILGRTAVNPFILMLHRSSGV